MPLAQRVARSCSRACQGGWHPRASFSARDSNPGAPPTTSVSSQEVCKHLDAQEWDASIERGLAELDAGQGQVFLGDEEFLASLDEPSPEQ